MDWLARVGMKDGMAVSAAIALCAAFDAVAAAIEPPFLFWQREILEPEQRAMAAVGVTQYAMLNSTRHYEHPYWTGPGELSTKSSRAGPTRSRLTSVASRPQCCW